MAISLAIVSNKVHLRWFLTVAISMYSKTVLFYLHVPFRPECGLIIWVVACSCTFHTSDDGQDNELDLETFELKQIANQSGDRQM